MLKFKTSILLLSFSAFCFADPDCSDAEGLDEVTAAYCNQYDDQQKIVEYNQSISVNLNELNSKTCQSKEFMIAMKEYQDSFIASYLAKCKVKTFCGGDGGPIDCGMGQSESEALCNLKATAALIENLKTESFSNEHCSIPKLKN